jgi:hypothetical protein
MALTKLDDILNLGLDEHDENFPTVLRVQMTAVQTVMNTQVKVDEQRLKQRQEDKLPELLARLLEEEKKLAIQLSPQK